MYESEYMRMPSEMLYTLREQDVTQAYKTANDNRLVSLVVVLVVPHILLGTPQRAAFYIE